MPQLTLQSFTSDLVKFGLLESKTESSGFRQEILWRLQNSYDEIPDNIQDFVYEVISNRPKYILEDFRSPWAWIKNFIHALESYDLFNYCGYSRGYYDYYDSDDDGNNPVLDIFKVALPQNVWRDVIVRYEFPLDSPPDVKGILLAVFKSFGKFTLGTYLKFTRENVNSGFLNAINDGLVQEKLQINFVVAENLGRLDELTKKNPTFYDYVMARHADMDALELTSISLLAMARDFQYSLPTQQELARGQ